MSFLLLSQLHRNRCCNRRNWKTRQDSTPFALKYRREQTLMSFKDKLGSIKKRKQPSKKMPKISENLPNSADFPSLDDVSDMPDALADKAANAKDRAMQEADAVISQAKGIKAKGGKGLFAKSAKASKAKGTASSDAKQLKRNISLLSLLLVGLLGVLAYLFMQKDTPSTPAAPVAAKPKEVLPPADLSVNAESPDDTTASATANADTGTETAVNTEEGTAQAAEDDSVAGAAGDESSEAIIANEADKLPEVIDREVPDNQVQAAEELDLLKDERQRLSEQEQLLKEQIDAQEKLTELKAKRIEMLKSKIATAEGTAN